jgi:CheY-like chemotaxis protein
MPEYSVLIVEDDPIIVRVLYSMLEYGNFHVLTPIDSGEQVIEQVTLEKPDIVLMDIDLPGVITGIDTASILFRLFNIPVIFVTGHDEKTVLERAIGSMPFGFLIKPVNPTLLISSIMVSVNMCMKMRQTTEGRLSGLSDSMLSRLTGASGYHILVDDQNYILLANQGAEELFRPCCSDLFYKNIADLIRSIIPDEIRIGEEFNDLIQNQRLFIVTNENEISECTLIIESIKDLFGERSGSFISLIMP